MFLTITLCIAVVAIGRVVVTIGKSWKGFSRMLKNRKSVTPLYVGTAVVTASLCVILGASLPALLSLTASSLILGSFLFIPSYLDSAKKRKAYSHIHSAALNSRAPHSIEARKLQLGSNPFSSETRKEDVQLFNDATKALAAIIKQNKDGNPFVTDDIQESALASVEWIKDNINIRTNMRNALDSRPGSFDREDPFIQTIESHSKKLVDTLNSLNTLNSTLAQIHAENLSVQGIDDPPSEINTQIRALQFLQQRNLGKENPVGLSAAGPVEHQPLANTLAHAHSKNLESIQHQ